MVLKHTFKFGFELEAFGDVNKFKPSDYDDYYRGEISSQDCNFLYENNSLYCQFTNLINDFFVSNYGLDGECHYDGSVRDYDDGFQAFEWASPILDYKPSTICTVKHLLKDLPKNGIFTNETCGFHTHISYPGICENDVLWFLFCLSSDKNKVKDLTVFSYKDVNGIEHTIDFFNERYANKKFLDNLYKYYIEGDYNKVCECLSTEKYNIIRIHPQGTLEWRGPREFLDDENAINEYFKKLDRFINYIHQSLCTKDINGITKEEFLETICYNKTDIISSYNAFPTITNKRQNSVGYLPECGRFSPILRGNSDIIADKIEHDPQLLLTTMADCYALRICRRLFSNDKLRDTVEKAMKYGKLSKNVQIAMFKSNPTLLPYVSDEVIKTIGLDSIIIFISQGLNLERLSQYKKDMILFIFNNLIKRYKCDSYILLSLLKYDSVLKFLLENMTTDDIYKIFIQQSGSDGTLKKTIELRLKSVLTMNSDTKLNDVDITPSERLENAQLNWRVEMLPETTAPSNCDISVLYY